MSPSKIVRHEFHYYKVIHDENSCVWQIPSGTRITPHKKTVVMSERIESLLKQERTAAYHLYKPIHHQIITSLPQTMSQTVKPSLIIISNSLKLTSKISALIFFYRESVLLSIELLQGYFMDFCVWIRLYEYLVNFQFHNSCSSFIVYIFEK